MKRILAIAILVSMVAISLTSCKSHEKCPAYSKVEESSKKTV